MIIPGMVPTPLDNYRVIGSPGSFCGAKFFGELPLELGNWRRPRFRAFRIYGIFGSFSSPFFFSHSTWREIAVIVISYKDLF